jgi:hypothetical protein
MSGLQGYTYLSDFEMTVLEYWRLKPDEDLVRGIAGVGQGIL